MSTSILPPCSPQGLDARGGERDAPLLIKEQGESRGMEQGSRAGFGAADTTQVFGADDKIVVANTYSPSVALGGRKRECQYEQQVCEAGTEITTTNPILLLRLRRAKTPICFPSVSLPSLSPVLPIESYALVFSNKMQLVSR